MNHGRAPDYERDDLAPGPYDIPAEQAVLGAMMLSEAQTEACRSALDAEDFLRPAHQVIFRAICAITRAGQRADVITVKDRLLADGELHRIDRGPVYLSDLIGATPAAVNAQHYARIVRDRAVRRRLLLAGRRVIQLADTAADDAHGLAERAIREVEAVRESGISDGLTVRTIAEFMDVPEGADDYDWIVPGLIERGDRLMLTGMEGAGKSTLMRQFAVAVAAGFHPLTHEPTEPRRVMLIDNQDSERQIRRKTGPLLAQARLLGREIRDDRLWIEARGRMDLALDRDASWLLRQVASVRPDIVLIGPLCNLAPRALNTDDDAAPVLAALDMVREREAALILEGHAGHGLGPGGRRDMRPRGSSLLLGWPEFGYGLRWSEDPMAEHSRTVDMVSWRGDRDEREWPELLTQGGSWPWRAATPGTSAAPPDSWTPHKALEAS